MGPATDKHHAPTHRLKLYVRAVIESEAWPTVVQVVIRQCEGYTQNKPEVVDYCEPFRDFLHQILKCILQRESFEDIITIAALSLTICWLLTSMLFSLNSVKFMGIFCKVFVAYKQARDSTVFY